MMMGTNVAASANSLDMTHTTHSAKTPHFHTTAHHYGKALRTKPRSLRILQGQKIRIFSRVPGTFFPFSRAIAGHTRAFERYVSPDVCCREPAHLIYVPGRWPFYEDSNAAFYPGPGFCF